MLRNQKPCLNNRQAENREQNNLANLLRQRLPKRVFRIIRKIGCLAEDSGFPAYIVGGFVRDLLLGVKNLDLDIVVEGRALDFVNLLKESLALDVLIHPRFATASITLRSGFKIDIASARREYYAQPAALPEVSLSSLKEDLLRRDFSINAMAIKINRKNFGELLDLFGGQRDLKERRLRVLHERSFLDDPTRALRAIRFEQRYNFVMERHTEILLKEAIRLGMLGRLSRFRIGDELLWILKEETPEKSLLRLQKFLGSLRIIHPAIKLDRKMLDCFKSARAVIISFKKRLSGIALESSLVYLLILTLALKLPEVKRLCRDFSLTKADTRKLEHFKKSFTSALRVMEEDTPLSPHKVYQVLSPFSYEEILALFCLARSKRAKRRLRLFLYKLSRINMQLKGEDLKRLQVQPGPRYKEILQEVLYAKIDGKLKSKVAELNYARKLLARKS